MVATAMTAARFTSPFIAAALTLGLNPAAAQTEGKSHPLSEVFVGVVDHDSGVFGRGQEEGPDINLEWRLDPLRGISWWDAIYSPRPMIGLNINTGDDTNTVYAGVTWTFDIWRNFFFDWGMGGALHDGETSGERPDKKELGSSVLFYLAAGIGYRLTEHHAISLRLDHMSNAKLADDNDGLDTLGIRYSYRF
jgi:hypothetical protein